MSAIAVVTHQSARRTCSSTDNNPYRPTLCELDYKPGPQVTLINVIYSFIHHQTMIANNEKQTNK